MFQIVNEVIIHEVIHFLIETLHHMLSGSVISYNWYLEHAFFTISDDVPCDNYDDTFVFVSDNELI